MKNDTRSIKGSNKTLTPADKSSNMYRLSKEEYCRLRTNAVTATYKKASNKLKEKVDKAGLKFAKKAGVGDRMEVNGTNNCFVTLKDHKDNFENNPTTRLINPAKNEVGRISKKILDKINSDLKARTGVNQWKSTSDVIRWFNNIEDKNSYTFTMFDVKDFYPSISENLLKEALDFARLHTTVSSGDVDVILHARKSLLFNEDHVWIKKNGGLFDVTMGAFDGVEICELVGIYMLSLISERCNKEDVGLYRDDGLSVFKNRSGPQNERTKKFIQKVFRDHGLDIVIQCNMKIVNYLDATFNLNTGTTSPYRKADNETDYIHAESDHPPNIIRQLPISVENRLSSLSSSEAIFNDAKGYYQEALTRNGHDHQLRYNPPVIRPRQRRRNVLWFNPPYSKTVDTNVGKRFLCLLDKHFPVNNKFNKIFNRNNVKISYGCMPNIGGIISSHNKKVLGENNKLSKGSCNCQRRYRGNCPLNGECLTPNAMYEAKVSSSEEDYRDRDYVGISKPVMKTRIGNHELSFADEEYSNSTELSKEIWKIKDRGHDYSVKWRIIKQYPSYNPVTKRCMLCLGEKMEILERSNENLLNKRSELISGCRHKKDFMLSRYDVK